MPSCSFNGQQANLYQLILPIYATAVDYTAQLTDDVILITATGRTVTLPTAVGNAGKRYVVKVTAPGSATVAAKAGELIENSAFITLINQNDGIECVSDGSAWWIIGAAMYYGAPMPSYYGQNLY